MVTLDSQINELQAQIKKNQRLIDEFEESKVRDELIEVNQKLILMLDTLYASKVKEKDCEVKDFEMKSSKKDKVIKIVFDALKVVVPLVSTGLIINYDRTGHIIPWKMIDYSDKKSKF